MKTIALAIAFCFLVNITHGQPQVLTQDKFLEQLKLSPCILIDNNHSIIQSQDIQLNRIWNGNTCKSNIKNNSRKPISLSSIVLFDMTKHQLPANAMVYGEGFQMLHQNGGTLARRENIGSYPDNKHYQIPEPNGMPTAYGALEIGIATNNHLLLGFSSCHKFIGRISYDSLRMQISFDAEGLTLKPGEQWNLEDFVFLKGANRSLLFEQLGKLISKNHPRLNPMPIPTGWCSWYCYGPSVTARDIDINLDTFSKKLPQLKYIQIDDGYQPFMGDWLDENKAYGNIQQTLKSIKEKGFEPAIWVAPFIAEKNSRLFKEHPEWFVKDKLGNPLNSATVGFGGWRKGPWYVLDGTNPAVQAHLQKIFRTMREQWGVNYFKLDANYWGAIHNGVHYNTNATRIEAYRLGMKAIISGCDQQTVLLGCNAPIWPSFGLVSAMRTSGDINRHWKTIQTTAKENLYRAWQNGILWDVDPDCIVLVNDQKTNITNDEWMFHASALHAVGGLMLSGDKAFLLKEKELSILKKLLIPTGKAAIFSDDTMQTAINDLGDKQYYYFFNWGETELQDLKMPLKYSSQLTDYWTGEKIGKAQNTLVIPKLLPHSAKLIEAIPVRK